MANTVDEKTGEVKTPEQLAKEALKPIKFSCEFNPNVDSDLDICARYQNRNTLVNSRDPEKLWNKMKTDWRVEALVELIKAKAKIVNDGMDARERKTAAEQVYIQHLVSTGMSYTDARKKATGK